MRDHVITLSGHVRWAFQSEAAMRTVAHIDGARGVRNTITLTVTPTRSA